jgi:hypothetical protein
MAKGSSLDFGDLSNYKYITKGLKGVDKALMFKWLVYMYDSKSPLVNIEDIRKRAVIAASEAGFPRNTRKQFDKVYGKVVMFDNSIMVDLGKMIVEYCKIQRNASYMQLAVYETLMVDNNELLLNPETDTSERSKIIDMQAKLTGIISTLREKFLNGDSTDKTYAEVMDAIENENNEFSPEQVVLNDKTRQAVNEASPYGYYNGKLYTIDDLNEKERIQLEKELANDTEECKVHFQSLGI